MKKLLKILLKSILAFVAVLLLAFVVLKIIYSDDIPKGTTGEKADVLANKMLDALNYDRFKDAQALHWTFRDKNTYKWDLQKNTVEVFWNDYHVTYHTKNKSKSKAYLNKTLLEGEAREKALSYAIKNFNNDSFWVVAPFKVFDSGTNRSIVEEDGKQKLLVQYTSGGTTPNDAYLWELDDEYIPVAFKMWVSILPFDGIEALWSDWETTSGGFLISKRKTMFWLDIPVTNLKVIP